MKLAQDPASVARFLANEVLIHPAKDAHRKPKIAGFSRKITVPQPSKLV
jgi:hypothetical protein